jgi:glycosyltransferase involved in cell wall biosynthesis
LDDIVAAMNPDSSNKPLRILAIVNLPWDPRLGAARVWIQLSEEWREAGHTVEKFCLTDAFPNPTASRALSAWRQTIFPSRAARFVRENAHRFDIIDCLIGTLPFSKKSLGFQGLIVARSIGLHRLYERFELLSRERWPDQPKGRLFGTVFYKLRAGRLRKNADEAIRRCDLLNLPNENELQELERSNRLRPPAIIEPYGLNDQYRAALAEAAQPAAVRLEKKKICFIGMWSLRKGSRDWPEIVRRIWNRVPDARFVFLGTMFSAELVFSELGGRDEQRVECVPTYDPSELPNLLRDCAVGLFPSYVEGFGLAVLEQLAAGIPAVAYDVPGPRQILESHRKLLLAREGDIDALVYRAIQILQSSPQKYAELSAQCVALAAKYRWSEIAAETMRKYRAAFDRLSDLVVFTQPFSLTAAGGGPRILRSLLKDAPVPTLAVCTAPPGKCHDSELQVPLRPNFGRVERTRFNALAHSLTPLFHRRFTRRLEKVIADTAARAVHSIAHGGLDFHSAFLLARKFKLPFFLQVHDDVAYTSGGRVPDRCVAEAWQGAATRFVISRELGAEYTKRYGEQEFVVVTDGVEKVASNARKEMNGLRIYFMGLFHLGYEENLEALMKAIALLPPRLTSNCSITLRCDYIRPALLRQSSLLDVLPFASEADVQADMAKADCLYLPLHFGEADQPFAAYSLSTKMVTYLGSGIPIFYHGPAGTAAYNILQKNRAAALATSLVPVEIAAALTELLQPNVGFQFAENALQLARNSFLRRDQHAKFWQHVLAAINPNGNGMGDRDDR